MWCFEIETTFLQTGDELFFYVYDATKNSPESVLNHAKGKQNTLNNSSILHQSIV
ncbi:MAG: DUF5718 family protein [Thiomicrorhabdus sp.]|nr:DUF5718 family protein [Thiomicrorhabdus sp.]